MPETVKPDLRAARVEQTEERILVAAQELFVRDGYAATTLAAVAVRAGVGERTVYVRFGTKAALLKRAVDVAIVGDTRPVAVAERDWYQRALTAKTLRQRIDAHAAGAAALFARAGDVFAVAREAESIEPLIAAASDAGRAVTRANVRRVWTTARDDGLLPADIDLDWLAETTGLLAHADTYLLMRKTIGWSPEEYGDWLRITWSRLVAGARRKVS